MQVMQEHQEEEGQKPFPIFGLGQHQRVPFVSTVKRVNCVVEMTDNGRQQAAIFGLPGLEVFIDLGNIPCRGIYTTDNSLTFYAVTGDQIIRASYNQSPTIIGSLTTDQGPVWMDSNGSQLFINDGVTAYIYTFDTQSLEQIADPNFPVGARGGMYLAQRFLVYTPSDAANSGRIYASDQADGLAWDPLNFFTPESVPDGIRGITRWFNDCVVFGDSSIEWWASAPTTLAGALGFRPITGANSEVGLEAELGLAGADQNLYFVGNGNGQTGIYKLKGYTAVKISPPSIDEELVKRATHSIAICTAYMVSGHPIFQLTLPNPDKALALTIIYDALTDLWSFRESAAKPYYMGLFAVTNNDAVYITDAFSGAICKMVATVFDECGGPMVFEVTSIHIMKDGDTLSIDKIQIDVETGLGTATGQGSDPQGMIQVSKDGGRIWGSERMVSLGKIGKYRARAIRRRIGAARDLAIRFRITDPIPRRVTGAYLKLTAGVA